LITTEFCCFVWNRVCDEESSINVTLESGKTFLIFLLLFFSGPSSEKIVSKNVLSYFDISKKSQISSLEEEINSFDPFFHEIPSLKIDQFETFFFFNFSFSCQTSFNFRYLQYFGLIFITKNNFRNNQVFLENIEIQK